MRKVLFLSCMLCILSLSVSAQSRHSSTRKVSKSKTSKVVKKTPPNVTIATEQENGTDYVDLGLSVKWAVKNLGASLNTQVGGEYLWGNPNKQRRGVYNDDSSIGDSYPSGYGVMRLDDDAARKALGGSWRVPTLDEFEELKDECTWHWVKGTGNDGKKYNGYRVTGPNGNSIFLPRPVCRCSEYEECNTFYMLSTYHRDGFMLGDRFCVDENSVYSGNYGIGFGYYIRAVCE